MAEHAPLPEGRRTPAGKGCLGCLLIFAGVVILSVAALFLNDCWKRHLAAKARSIGEHYHPGDLNGAWEGEWNWSDQKSRILFDGSAVRLENFPLSDSEGNVTAINAAATFTPPQWYSSPRDMAILVSLEKETFPLFFTSSASGELKLRYDCDVVFDREIVFRRKPAP